MRVARVANLSNVCTCKYVANRLLIKKQKTTEIQQLFQQDCTPIGFRRKRTVNRTDTHVDFRWCMCKTVSENSTVGSDEQFSTGQHLLRPASNVRAIASQSNTTSFRIVVRTRRTLPPIVSKCFWMAARHER